MALTPCRECGEQVSTVAATCPHCGIASPGVVLTPSTAKDQQLLAYGCLVSVLALAAIGYYSCRGDSSVSAPAATSDAVDLSGPGPFTLKGDYVVCLTESAMTRANAIVGSGDTPALTAFLVDRSNGCTPTKPGVRVYADPAGFGVEQIRAVGSANTAFVVREALAR